MQTKLKTIELRGYKSVSGDGQTLPLNDDVTVLIGANGAGKSNIVFFFQLLGKAMNGAVQTYIAENGFADSLLYYGSKNTNSINALLHFSNGECHQEYKFKLTFAAGDTLIFSEEMVCPDLTDGVQPTMISLDAGKRESQLPELTNSVYADKLKPMISLLKRCRYFQFHDTTKEAAIRRKGYIADSKSLHSNASNLAAFLYAIKHQQGGEPYYKRIVRYIQQVMPQFEDFILEPSVTDENYISLDWREKGSDYIFSVNQISDGTLRFMALTTLLLQPPKSMPSIIVIDEPELGLHPKAISILAGMIKKASANVQIIIATQSPRLLDEFSADKVVVIERDEQRKTTMFRQLSKEMLESWEEEYTTSELWDKNVIGGRP